MSYTRPAASAADLTWVGKLAYVRPAANSADLSFSAYLASGFKATNFGTPALLPTAVGFKPINFGTVMTGFFPVSGFSATNFGTPVAANFFQVTGFAPLNFGTPMQLPNAVGFKAANFGIPSIALKVVGWNPLHFGAITQRSVNRVSSFRACHFGATGTPTNRTCAVRGSKFSRLGHPVAIEYLP